MMVKKTEKSGGAAIKDVLAEDGWVDVPGYLGRYQVNTDGRVRVIRVSDMTPRTGKAGYAYTILESGSRKKGGYRKHHLIHRLIAEAFLPNPENKPCVNHKDGDKSNNSLSNLEWATYSENTLHAYDNGLIISLKGEKHNMAKLTNAQALEIRGSVGSCKSVGAKYGVSAMIVSKIRRRELWAHL